MKRYLWIGLIIVTLIVDWTALDDITTGNELDYLGEWVTLYVSVPILLLSGWKIWKNKL